MRSIFEKIKTSNSIHFQLLLIIFAFIFCTSSFFFVRSIERKHLYNNAVNMLSFKETEFFSNFLIYETFLNTYSETIREMIISGENEDTVSAYMADATGFMLNDRDSVVDLIDTHGIFFTWGEKYISGTNTDWVQLVDLLPQEWPCHKAAYDADGKTIISELYQNAVTRKSILSLSRYLSFDNGDPLGVVCLNIDFDRISRNAITMNLTEGNYGILLNDKLEILAHSETYYIGRELRYIGKDFVKLASELETGRNIYEQKIKDYAQNNSIVYFKKIKYDWYLGTIIPAHEYNRNIYRLIMFLFLTGSMLTTALCIIINRISLAKKKTDLRTQQRSNFLATMSHEIRTPLNAILGMTEIQMQNIMHSPATTEAFIKINNSGNLLLNIINDILDLSKIEAGKLELVPVKYDVASMINDIVQLNYIRYEGKQIEFNIEIDENIPAVLVGDELRIKQILNHLLSNAFKYTDSGQVTFSVNAELVGRAGSVLVTLIFQIKDTGHGMTSAQVSKLFDDYTRFNLEADRTTEGAGLGMTITRNLIELMYGKISVKSAVGEGTTVTVRLPQKTDGPGIKGVIGKELANNLQQHKMGNIIKFKKSQISHEYMPYGRVLIVDDVETNLYVAKGLMVPYGLKIDLAVSGFEAIEKVKEGNVYDIIFMDHMMPKLDGIEATKLIRETGYTHPIVALTANALAGQADIFLKNGFDGFISKPIDVRQLNVTLNKLVRDKYPSEVIEAAQKKKAEMDKKQENSLFSREIDPQLAVIFARDAQKAAAVLETLLQNNFQTESDIQLYIINVHAMKSALANIGEVELSKVALKLEESGREKDIQIMTSETRGFIDELHKVIKKINPNDANEDIEDSEDAIILLRNKMQVIKDSCLSLDKKTAKSTLNELKEKTWSSKTKDSLNLISEHLLHSDFDKAAAVAEEYLN